MNWTQQISKRFSKASSTYDENAIVQKHAAQELSSLIPKEHPKGPILEIGCGTGTFTELIRQKFPYLEMDVVDISPEMLRLHRSKWKNDGKISWHEADIISFSPGKTYPLILSNCALHWAVSLNDAFKNIHSLLDQDGVLTASIMVRGTLRELHESRLKVAPQKQTLASLPSSHEIISLLGQSRFHLSASFEKESVVYHPSSGIFLKQLAGMGVTGGKFSGAKMPLNRTDVRNLIRYYDENYREDRRGVRATFNVLYLTAKK